MRMAGANRSAWAPHAGQVSLDFHDIVVPASRGLRAAEARLLIPYYDLSRMVEVEAMIESPMIESPMIESSMIENSMIESFDAQRSAARRYVQDRIEAAAKVLALVDRLSVALHRWRTGGSCNAA